MTKLNAAMLARAARRERAALLALSVPALAAIAALIFIPVGWLFALSFVGQEGLTLEHYRRMVENEAYLAIFAQTFEISAVVTLLAIILGYPLAYVIALAPRHLATVCLALVLVPFWTALLVRTYAWLVILQRRGLVNEWLAGLGVIEEPLRLVHNYTGTVIGMLHIMLPFMVLPLFAAMRAIDRTLLQAAANLGASPTAAFWRVWLPLSLPGLVAGTLLVFILCLGFYVTPEILGGGRVNMVAMKIRQNVTMYYDWGAASALGVVLLVATAALFAVLSRILRVERLFGGR